MSIFEKYEPLNKYILKEIFLNKNVFLGKIMHYVYSIFFNCVLFIV